MKRLCPRRFRRHLPRLVTTNAAPGLPGGIHALDSMLTQTSPAGLDAYVAAGQSAMDNCAASLAAMQRSFADIKTCLDLPCGHGRVLRWLQTRIDPAGITACDIDREAVDFCRTEFGVKGVYSSDEPGQLVFPDSYDLIWVGSLLTHLDPRRCAALLGKLSSSLRENGVLIFTTHGESCFTYPGLLAYGKRFHATADRLQADFRREGHCYAPYEDTGYYGIALHSENFVKQLMTTGISARMQLVRFQARGWHGHQDVWSYRRI